MESEQLLSEIEIVKNDLPRYLNIDKSSIIISEPIHNSSGFKVEIVISYKIRGNKLRIFNLETYSFSINQICEEGFMFENRYYGYSNIGQFSEEISTEIQNI